jgi:hypothetical protein
MALQSAQATCCHELPVPKAHGFARNAHRTRHLGLTHAIHQQASGPHPTLVPAVVLPVALIVLKPASRPELARPRMHRHTPSRQHFVTRTDTLPVANDQRLAL